MMQDKIYWKSISNINLSYGIDCSTLPSTSNVSIPKESYSTILSPSIKSKKQMEPSSATVTPSLNLQDASIALQAA